MLFAELSRLSFKPLQQAAALPEARLGHSEPQRSRLKDLFSSLAPLSAHIGRFKRLNQSSR
jgi:hypothetical protein